jgi:hypothetical protein
MTFAETSKIGFATEAMNAVGLLGRVVKKIPYQSLLKL